MVLATLTVLAGGKEDDYDTFWEDQLSDEDFEKVFELVDDDNSGTVTQTELISFIKIIG